MEEAILLHNLLSKKSTSKLKKVGIDTNFFLLEFLINKRLI